MKITLSRSSSTSSSQQSASREGSRSDASTQVTEPRPDVSPIHGHPNASPPLARLAEITLPHVTVPATPTPAPLPGPGHQIIPAPGQHALKAKLASTARKAYRGLGKGARATREFFAGLKPHGGTPGASLACGFGAPEGLSRRRSFDSHDFFESRSEQGFGIFASDTEDQSGNHNGPATDLARSQPQANVNRNGQDITIRPVIVATPAPMRKQDSGCDERHSVIGGDSGRHRNDMQEQSGPEFRVVPNMNPNLNPNLNSCEGDSRAFSTDHARGGFWGTFPGFPAKLPDPDDDTFIHQIFQINVQCIWHDITPRLASDLKLSLDDLVTLSSASIKINELILSGIAVHDVLAELRNNPDG